MRKIAMGLFLMFATVGLAKADFGLFVGLGFGLSGDLSVTAPGPANGAGVEVGGVKIGAFYESATIAQSLGLGEKSFMGTKIAYTKQDSQIFLTGFPGSQTGIEMGAYTIPLTVYYGYNLTEKVKLKGGLGLTFATAQITTWLAGMKMSGTDMKIAPHLEAGIEYVLGKVVGIQLDFSYLMGGDWGNNGMIKMDLSGLYIGGAVNFRIF